MIKIQSLLVFVSMFVVFGLIAGQTTSYVPPTPDASFMPKVPTGTAIKFIRSTDGQMRLCVKDDTTGTWYVMGAHDGSIYIDETIVP